MSKIENAFVLEDIKKEHITFMQGYVSESYVEQSIKLHSRNCNGLLVTFPSKNWM